MSQKISFIMNTCKMLIFDNVSIFKEMTQIEFIKTKLG